MVNHMCKYEISAQKEYAHEKIYIYTKVLEFFFNVVLEIRNSFNGLVDGLT